jgi:ElaB/YqjD/DUF883 family membrane-anchored ribosome-binding protein
MHLPSEFRFYRLSLHDPFFWRIFMTTAASEKLMTDVKVVLTDAENLLNRAAEASGEQAADLRARGMQMLRQARQSAQELQETAVARGRAAGRAADAYVHEHPWRIIGVAAGIGLLAGLLLNRK